MTVQTMFADALRYHQSGRLDAAEQLYREILRIDSCHADALHLLGVLAHQGGRPDIAVDLIGKAIAQNGHMPAFHNNLGFALQDRGELDAAAAAYGRALFYKPDYAKAHYNLGNTLQAQGKPEAALASYEQALIYQPDDAEAHYNRGTLLLQSGRYAEGWPEYEWRWGVKSLTQYRRDYGVPRWDGENLDGRTILLHAEQGMGDTIQFCRYVPMVAALGARVVLEVQRPVLRLLSGLSGIAEIVAVYDPLPAVDLSCPLMSLPRVFESREETIPNRPYLTADPARAAAWGDRLPRSGYRIGVAWQGNPAQKNDHNRSMSPAYFAPLAPLSDTAGLHFVSLQKEGPAALERFPLIDFMGEIGDFADTAALIANLDLVITVDTAVAHLASAIGKPVWLLNCYDPCWRWLRNRRDSPWYPLMRIFRQSSPGAWEGVIAEVAAALRSQAVSTGISRASRSCGRDACVARGAP